MPFGLGLGILLICLLEAELVCCSWSKEALSPGNGKTRAGFPLLDSRLSKFSSFLQDHFRRGFISPRSAQSEALFANPAVNSGNGRYAPLSKTVQRSSRLGQKHPFPDRVKALSIPKPLTGPVRALIGASVSQSSENKKGTLSVQPRTGKSPVEGYSVRPVVHPAAKRDPLYKTIMPLSAILFGPVAPGPRGSTRQMQTYAQAPARRVSPSPSGLAKSVSLQAVAGKQHVDPQPALNASGFGPRSTEGATEPGYAAVTVYELPEPFGGSVIRRLAVQMPRWVSSLQ